MLLHSSYLKLQFHFKDKHKLSLAYFSAISFLHIHDLNQSTEIYSLPYGNGQLPWLLLLFFPCDLKEIIGLVPNEGAFAGRQTARPFLG